MPPEAARRNRAVATGDAGSILHLYRRVIALRHASPALSRGTFEFLDVPDGVLGFRRTHGDDSVDVLVNFGGDAVDLGPRGSIGAEVLLVSDDPDPSGPFTGVLGPDQAVVVRS